VGGEWVDVSDKRSENAAPEWEQWVAKRLPLYGHRNWIVVADAAYPAQSREGIETIAVGGSQESVVENVLKCLQASRHVRPIIYVDQELEFLDEKDAPGAGRYREWLAEALQGVPIKSLLHEEIIAKLDQAARTFCVTVLKTDMIIPYTTVFFELDCGYWNADAEKRLRSAIQT
jgi:L-fucose mutarotase/ribose pyranase (RbsD/FucU family)